MTLEGLIAQPAAYRIGWALAHFVWQGAAAAAVAAVVLRALRNSSANARYVAACAALAVMAALPVGTFALLGGGGREVAGQAATYETPNGIVFQRAVTAETAEAVPRVMTDVAPVPTAELARATEGANTAGEAGARRLREALEPYMPWVAAAWAFGVMLLSARFSVGYIRVRRISGRATPVAGGDLRARLQALARRLRVSRPVRLMESAVVRTPLMIGWLKPVILFPAGMATGLPLRQVEAIIAHELAHIRRHDYVVNLVQGVAETVLFYHPCVWWISRRIRIEREHCADDVAAEACGDRVLYARTLADLAEGRAGRLAVAASGGELFARVRRLVRPEEHASGASSALAGAAIAVAAVALLVLVAVAPVARAQKDAETGVKSTAASASTDTKPAGTGGRGVSGIVVDEGGKPVEGAEVRVFGARLLIREAVRTDKEGVFRLGIDRPSFMHAGVVATADGGLRQGIYANESADEEAGAKPILITLKRSRTVRASVVDGRGKPVEGAPVQIYHLYCPLPATATDASGAAEVRYPADAHVLWITAMKPGIGFDYYENYTQEPPALEKSPALPAEVRLILDGAMTVKVKAVDSSGKPVGGVAFVPWSIQKKGKISSVNLSGGAWGVQTGLVRSDSNGIAVFDWLPRELAKDTKFPVTDEAFHCPDPPGVKAGKKGGQVVARLLRTTRISGKVLLPDGKPGAGITVQAEGRGKTNFYCRELAESGEDGSYSISAYPDQSYIVAVTDKDWAAANYTGIVVREGKPAEGLDFHLDKGTLVHGKVTAEGNGAPAAGEIVTLVYKGRPLPDEIRSKFEGEESLVRWATTDRSGEYAFRVGKGNYDLWASDDSKREKLAVGDEAEIVNDFAVRPGAMTMITLTGTVIEPDAGNRAVPGAVIQGMPEGSGTVFETTADSNGRFTATRLPREMAIYARNPEGTLAGVKFISDGDEEVRILVSEAASVSGRVVDGEGKPLAKRRVVCQMDVRMIWFLRDAVTDGEGRYAIGGLLPGSQCSVRCVVDPDSGEPKAQLKPFTATPGKTTLADLVVNAPAATAKPSAAIR